MCFFSSVRMDLQKIFSWNAVAIREYQVRGTGCFNCPVQDGTFAEANVFVPDMLNRIGYLFFQQFNPLSCRLTGSVVGNDHFKITVALCFKSPQYFFKPFRRIIGGYNDR